MSHLWNLVKKELKELLTPSSLISVIVVMILFIAMGSFLGGETKDATSLKPIGYVDLSEKTGVDYAGYGVMGLEEYYKQSGCEPSEYVVKFDISASFDDKDAFNQEIYDNMIEKDIDTVLVITQDFNKNLNQPVLKDHGIILVYWNQNSLGIFSAISSVTSDNAIAVMNETISDIILVSKGVDADELAVATHPCYNDHKTQQATFLKGQIHDGVSPDQIYGALSQQNMFVPIIIMLIIVMIGSIVISSMGNEKENKTLETLLTLPVNRTTIVAGKLIGSTIAGLIMGVLYMIGMYFYISGASVTGSSGVSMKDLGLSLSPLDWVIVTAFMFLAIIAALGICMILGAMAKNYKAAQTYIMPISILAVIPMFVTMFSSIDSLPAIAQVLMFAIPFTHPMTIIQNLMFGNTLWIVGGAIYLVIFTAITFIITVRIYNSDILITGISLRKKGNNKSGEQQEEEIVR